MWHKCRSFWFHRCKLTGKIILPGQIMYSRYEMMTVTKAKQKLLNVDLSWQLVYITPRALLYYRLKNDN